MSINSALLAGVSGLTANSAALAAISQNIANVNTVGYKRTASEFQTLVNSQTASGGSYSAGGVTTIVDMPYDEGDLICSGAAVKRKVAHASSQARVSARKVSRSVI